MRNTPDMTDKWDREDVERLNAAPWMLDLLELNPGYTSWGPHEDYMGEDGNGWRARVIVPTWAECRFGPDDLNEVVNFYFSVTRDSQDCPMCEGNGYHPDAQAVVNGFYPHMNDARERWSDKITDDEVGALWDAGRLKHDFPERPTADAVNAWERRGGFGHDAINRAILTERRLERLGLPKVCPACDQHGYVYTVPEAHVSLTLWVIHPRKGASRGVEVSHVKQGELPAIFAYLNEAAARNAERFARIPQTPAPDSAVPVEPRTGDTEERAEP